MFAYVRIHKRLTQLSLRMYTKEKWSASAYDRLQFHTHHFDGNLTVCKIMTISIPVTRSNE